MKFEEIANGGAKSIDPPLYEFLIFFLGYTKKIRTVFSCSGHRPEEPAWILFDVIDRQWFDKLRFPSYCKLEGDRLFIYHKNKYPDLFRKLKNIEHAIRRAK